MLLDNSRGMDECTEKLFITQGKKKPNAQRMHLSLNFNEFGYIYNLSYR